LLGQHDPIGQGIAKYPLGVPSRCERVIGTLWRECLDHVVAVNEQQLKRVLDEYVRYYNTSVTTNRSAT